MKKISVVVVAVALLSVGNVFAADNPRKAGPEKTLSGQIAELLNDNPFVIDKDITATVRFTLNSKKEIVVLYVDTDDKILENFVKSRLNYEKVNLPDTKEGRYYTVPVRITPA